MSDEFKSTIILNEQKIVRCIIENPSLLYDLQPDWFSCSESRKLYLAIKYLYENNVEINRENIAVKTGQPAYMDAPAEIFPVEYNIAEWQFYVNSMKLDYVKQDVYENVVKKLSVSSMSKEQFSFDELKGLHQRLTEDIDLMNGNENRLQKITQIGQRYHGTLVSRKLGESYSYGDYLIDRLIPTGAAPGQITTIFGSTGMGKSMFSLNLFSKQINKRIPCMYVTLEMDEITTLDRLVALRQRIPYKYLLMKNTGGEGIDDMLNPDYIIELCDKELESLKRYEDRFFLVDEPSLSLDDLESLIADAKKRMGVDYLICTIDLWTMLHGVTSKATDIEDAVNRTSEIAKRQKVHLINVVQANREADKKSVSSIENLDSLRIKTVNSIKNSGAIGERSRAVLSVFRPKHYAETLFPDDPQIEFMDDVFEVSLVKANNAQVGGKVKYLYDAECFRLCPFIEKEEEMDNEN